MTGGHQTSAKGLMPGPAGFLANRRCLRRTERGKDCVTMKKILSIALILMLMTLPLASYAGAVETVPAAAEEETAEQIEYDHDHLVVGITTPFSGQFFTNMWGGVTSDLDVQKLIHGYNLVAWRSDIGGAYDIDPTVVSGFVATQSRVTGDRTYTFEIYNDLKYSDGTKITAWDYAFSWLISMAPQVAELGGNVRPMEYLEGYADYVNGRVPYLAGIRVLDNTTIAITVDKAYLPFFYQMALLDCVPYPISVIAPGCSVADDGRGIYLKGPFTADLLRSTLLDETNGYCSHPSVTSGPYVLTSFDGSTAEFELNRYYKGNKDGIRPIIRRLTYKTVANESMLDEFKAGNVTLLNKVMNADVLNQLVPMVEGQGQFASSSYGRTGMSYISFSCERPAVSSLAVRQAVAMCVDKDSFVTATVGDYGQRADGYYGIGQWMYTLVNAEDGYPVEEPNAENGMTQAEHDKALADWADLNMDDVPVYAFDPHGAAGVLESDGWTLNRNGESFDAARDDVRCKEINGEVVPLELKLICPEESKVADKLEQNFGAHLAKAGIGLTIEEQPLSKLLNSFYRRGERDADMIYIASNFGIVFDPAGNFRPDDANAVNMSNFSAINDSELYKLAVDMRQTEAGDLLAYCQKWVKFQQRFQEVVPAIPLYSGMYYDFYPSVLQNYDINANATWGEAIVEASMGNP